jgi:hypothetical protein
MNQRQATVTTLMSILSERGVSYELNGETPISQVLTKSDKDQAVSIISQGFLSGQIDMSAEGKAKYFSDEKELKKYVVGLVNNWIRKATEFNGSAKYEIKNKGSRAGSGDEQIKALKELLKQTTDAEVRAEIQEAINDRTEEIKPKAEINVDALPVHLRHLVK